MTPGPRNLITDVPGVLVGNAEDHRLKTGVTVLTSEKAFVAGVAVMGGAPGTRETELLSPENTVAAVDALVLAGGSAFGLDAASGVTEALKVRGRGFVAHGHTIPIVPAAILFDLASGGEAWDTNPYSNLGRAALEASGRDISLGSVGVGTGATTANLKGGLGSASAVLANGVTVGAIVAVNAIGQTTDDHGRFWAAPFEINDEFGGLGPVESAGLLQPTKPEQRANTTIAVVATDLTLSKAQAERMALMAHAGLARAVVPSHTPFDGDIVFAASTGRIKTENPELDLMAVGHAAATCLARAIARGVHAATPAPGDPKPTWAEVTSRS